MKMVHIKTSELPIIVHIYHQILSPDTCTAERFQQPGPKKNPNRTTIGTGFFLKSFIISFVLDKFMCGVFAPDTR